MCFKKPGGSLDTDRRLFLLHWSEMTSQKASVKKIQRDRTHFCLAHLFGSRHLRKSFWGHWLTKKIMKQGSEGPHTIRVPLQKHILSKKSLCKNVLKMSLNKWMTTVLNKTTTNTGKERIWFPYLLDCNLYYVQFSTITTTTQNDKAHKRKQKNKKKEHYESLRDLRNTIKLSTYTLCELQKEKKKGGKTLEKWWS